MRKLTLFLAFLTFFACNSEKKTVQNSVNEDFARVKKEFANNDELFGIFNKDLTVEEIQAMQFLYAYMPLNDLADNDGIFYLKQVREALKTRELFSWGKEISDENFYHFVLPIRVNNEDLDDSRTQIFNELYPRVKDLTMKEAVLEVNHWCHEKATYTSTSSRTISPLGIMKTAYGRCGEESTFTVYALRAVGIPARQVYTPRWAHSDDNHAWVEVLVDGKWQYLGASEPEPDLNMGWFSAPALRAMRVHTKTFGNYESDEDIFNRNSKYTTLNTLENYTTAKDIWVKAVDEYGKALKNARVKFGLYNYAEFYPIKTQTTASNGLVHLKTGLGDLQIFISKNDKFAVQKISVEDIDTVVITLNRKVGDAFTLNFASVPPVHKEPVKREAKGVAKNKARLVQDDSIRNAFVAMFYDDKDATRLAKKLNVSAQKLSPLIIEARGNYGEIENYLAKAVEIDKPNALTLLQVISKKDLHDISAKTLLNHLSNFRVFDEKKYDKKIIEKYILNPRIYNEGVRPYRKFCQDLFKNLEGEKDVRKVASTIKIWLNENVQTDNINNYYQVPISPIGICKVKKADAFSKKLFFVAAMRSLGIPSRLEPVTLKAQFYKNDEWKNVYINDEKSNEISEKQGKIILHSSPKNTLEPLYQIHFSLAKFTSGRFETLLYDWEKPLKDFPRPLIVDEGYYCLVTGNRVADGSVMVHEQFFNVKANDNVEITVELNKDMRKLTPIGTQSVVKTTEEAQIVGWINPKTEPGNHFLYDFRQQKNTFEALGVKMKLFADSEKHAKEIKKRLGGLYTPKIDEKWELLKQLYPNKKLDLAVDLPIFIVTDDAGNIYYKSSGYNIGTSEQLLKIYNRLVDKK